MIVGADGIFRATTWPWTTILGHQPDEAQGQSFLDFIWPEDAAFTQDGLDLDGFPERSHQFRNRDRHKETGTPRWISWHTSVDGRSRRRRWARCHGREGGLDETGKGTRRAAPVAEARGRRATHRRCCARLQQSAHHHQVIERLLLRRPNLPDHWWRRYVDAISDTVDRAAKLVGQLLAFARRQALKPEVFDAAERVRCITDSLATVVGSRIRIVHADRKRGRLVEADVSQFSRPPWSTWW